MEGELWSLCLPGSRTGNWERWTDPCWASSILQQSDFHHRSTFATRITSHSSLLLSGCNSASQGLASLSKKPLMCCTAASPCRTWISAPAWLPAPFLTSQELWELLFFTPRASQSLDKPEPPQSHCRPCCGRVAREGREDSQGKKDHFSLASCCRQVLCPPSPPWSRAAEEAALRAARYKKLLQGPAKPPGLNSQPEAATPLGTQMRMQSSAACTWSVGLSDSVKLKPKSKIIPYCYGTELTAQSSHLHYHAR